MVATMRRADSARKHSDPGKFLPALDAIGLAAGAANVIMQLSWPSVGYGVYESKVESGRLYDHPVNRTRTTLTYLAVAARGTVADKRAYKKAVNSSHARVRSDENSAVDYNAFDPELQRWVAACLYRGFEDVYRLLHGEMDPVDLERNYQLGATFGTTLQMSADMWPETRADFEDYWNGALATVSIDDTIREHLLSIARVEFAGKTRAKLLGPLNLFLTTGFLPEEFRRAMRLDWDDRRQRRFERLMAGTGVVARRLPLVIRELPYRYLLADMRWRHITGRPLV